MSTRTGAGRRWIQCLATEVEALLFSVRGPTFFKGVYRLGGRDTEPDERQNHWPGSYMWLGAFADMSAPRRARQPGAAANGHRRSNQPSREQLHRENERLLRELEDLRRKVAERDRQIAEREKQIADAEKQIADAKKQIADLERQLAGRKKSSTNSSKPPSSDGLAGEQRPRGRKRKSKRK